MAHDTTKNAQAEKNEQAEKDRAEKRNAPLPTPEYDYTSRDGIMLAWKHDDIDDTMRDSMLATLEVAEAEAKRAETSPLRNNSTSDLLTRCHSRVRALVTRTHKNKTLAQYRNILRNACLAYGEFIRTMQLNVSDYDATAAELHSRGVPVPALTDGDRKIVDDLKTTYDVHGSSDTFDLVKVTLAGTWLRKG